VDWIHGGRSRGFLAAAFLLAAPLPATIAHTWRMPRGAFDRAACTAGQMGSLIFALIMAVQAAGWFEASAVSAGTSAEVRTAVASALYYNNQVLGGVVEFLAVALVAVWFAWVGMRAGSLLPLMRLVCLTESALILTGQWAGFMAIPLVASFLGVSVIGGGAGGKPTASAETSSCILTIF
jgi:hypothetical protein